MLTKTSNNQITPTVILAYIIAASIFVAGWHGFNVLIMIFVVIYGFWVYPVRRKR
jgi:uncharacterized membrane protein